MEYRTVQQAAADLGLSVRGIRNRIDRGDMAAVRVTARLYLIPTAEVERWRALGRQRPGPKAGATYGPQRDRTERKETDDASQD